MKIVYQACDGETFELPGEAVEHEDELFESWLANLIDRGSEPTLATVVRHFSESHHLTCEGDEHHMSPWDRLKESLRIYWGDEIIPRLEHTKRSD